MAILTILIISNLMMYMDAYGYGNFFATVNKYISLNKNLVNSPYSNFLRRSNNTVLDEYDFIIVGSGSAGSVVANRLSENPEWKVLLLEAGSRANTFSEIPLFAPILQLTPFNWNYTMERQEGFCEAMEDGLCAWPKGRALGGSTVINYMIYTRGNPVDFQKWVDQGNPGWSYDEVLKYYMKSENCNLGKECESRYHNKGGYLNVQYPFTSELTEAFLRAGEEIGQNLVDYNTPNYMGFSKIQANLKNGRRHSVSTAFLDPILHRTNLQILTSAKVTKILIDPVTKAAYGVEYIYGRKKFSVKARKEVVLSAGTFHSPQLLMLSGIGPRNHLKKLGIPLIQHSPVGRTLLDHISYLAAIFTINQTIISPTRALNPKEILTWITGGTGFLSSLGGVEAIAYVKTDVSQEKNNYPDVELLLASIGSLEFDFGLFSRPELRVRSDFYKEYFQPLENKPCYSILPMLLHPKSKGYLKLRSKDPYDQPLFFGNYFTDKENRDLKTMISSIRYIQELSKTEAFQKFGAKLYEKHVPGCDNFIFDTDTYWECAVRHLTVTLHHQIATCKMGPKDDSGAVVDNKLKVYGIKNLRVADSSIIPVTLSAHSSAPTMMIGEKMADILKEEWAFQ